MYKTLTIQKKHTIIGCVQKKRIERGENMKRLVVEVDDELHTAVKIEALMAGKPVKDYVMELVKKDLETKKEQSR